MPDKGHEHFCILTMSDIVRHCPSPDAPAWHSVEALEDLVKGDSPPPVQPRSPPAMSELTNAIAHPRAGRSSVLRWLVLGAAGLWLPMSLTYPFGWDQGLFAWVGGVIVDGGMPYADAWDFKGPLVYYAYALAETIFGARLWSIRMLDAALLIAAVFAVRRSAAELTDAAMARWAAALFFLWYASHSYWHTAQPDGWTAMLIMMGIAPVMRGKDGGRFGAMALAGACIGVASLFKPLNAIFLVLPVAYVLSAGRPRGMALSGSLLVGWTLPIALTVGWFALRGALDDLIAVHLGYSTLYAGLSPGDRLRGVAEYFLSSRVAATLLPLMVYGGLLLWRAHRPAAIVLGTWCALVVGSVALQNRFYAYHWLPLVPAATLLATRALHEIRSRIPALADVTFAIVLLQCLAPVVLEEARFAAWIVGRIDHDAYYDAYGEAGNDMRAVRWLGEEAQPGSVFVFGWHSGVPWLSGRQTVSRFGYSLPLMMGEGHPVRARYRAELLEALAATPPRYIIVGTQSERILGARLTIEDFPELADVIRRGYTEVRRFGTLLVYEPVPGTQPLNR
jgi:hypothetical protein